MLPAASPCTDTNAAVAGATLGARYGASAIPQRWLDCIPQREQIEELADGLSTMVDHERRLDVTLPSFGYGQCLLQLFRQLNGHEVLAGEKVILF